MSKNILVPKRQGIIKPGNVKQVTLPELIQMMANDMVKMQRSIVDIGRRIVELEKLLSVGEGGNIAANEIRVCREGHEYRTSAGQAGACWCGQPPKIEAIKKESPDAQPHA